MMPRVRVVPAAAEEKVSMEARQYASRQAALAHVGGRPGCETTSATMRLPEFAHATKKFTTRAIAELLEDSIKTRMAVIGEAARVAELADAATANIAADAAGADADLLYVRSEFLTLALSGQLSSPLSESSLVSCRRRLSLSVFVQFHFGDFSRLGDDVRRRQPSSGGCVRWYVHSARVRLSGRPPAHTAILHPSPPIIVLSTRFWLSLCPPWSSHLSRGTIDRDG